jgi:myo-inositol-1(or 4)-monophosphatase
MQNPAVNLMVKAARQAGQILLRHASRLDGLKVVEKARQDYASEVDSLAEAEIIRELKRAHPDYAFLGEESGAKGSGRYTWVIDPLDGTSNYLRGIPHYCVSIALTDRGEPQAGVIYDPLRNEIFTCAKGGGAYLNERRIRVAQRAELEGSLLITGFPPRERSRIRPHLAALESLMEQAEDVRRTGSAALDLAYAACGRVDGYFEAGLKPWDIAAGVLLVREAGGKVCDFRGGGDFMAQGRLVAGNLKLCDALQKRLADSGYAASFD